VETTKKFITVETNFRLYAFTNIDIEILILSFFVEMEVRMPNFVVGYITRNSVRNALKSGLTVVQIQDFLQNSCTEPIPDNVVM
jgi:transcription initiation factor TFIIH subunit 4